MDPIDEALAFKAGLQKEAMPAGRIPVAPLGSGFAGKFFSGAREAFAPKNMGGKASEALIGAAAVAAIPVAKKIYDSIQSRQNFKEMMGMYPNLEDARRENPRMFNATYNSFRRMAPSHAKDPLVTGSFMTNAMSQGDMTQLGSIVGSYVSTPRGPEDGASVSARIGPLSFKTPF